MTRGVYTDTELKKILRDWFRLAEEAQINRDVALCESHLNQVRNAYIMSRFTSPVALHELLYTACVPCFTQPCQLSRDICAGIGADG